MATVDDIDTKSAVRKFLERSSVLDREDRASDSSGEVSATLESVALSFLLNPQTALYFVILAKNALQENLRSDLDILDYLLKAVGDVDNPDSPIKDTSDLVEAQTALVEVDRLGRVGGDVKAFDRYNAAIQRFLDQQLARSLKRRRRDEFERSGFEAKQDLFRVLGSFEPIHSLVAIKLGILLNAVSDFRSVDLSRLVSATSIAKVRNSLSKVSKAIKRNTVSKTSIAIELLAGSSALQSISNSRDIFDPLVSTGTFPAKRTIYATSEQAVGEVSGVSGVVDISLLTPPWIFGIETNPNDIGNNIAYSIYLPQTSASGKAWVMSLESTADLTGNITVPALERRLYIELEGPVPSPPDPVVVVVVTLPTGVQSFSTLVSTIHTALSVPGYGGCVELASGARRFLIYGSAAVTKITLRTSVAGTFHPTTGVYTPSEDPAYAVLGFQNNNQTSAPIGQFAAAELMDILSLNVPTASFEVVDDTPVIASLLESPKSSLLFSGDVADAFGFSGLVRSNPSYLTLVENGEEIDPASLTMMIGSIVSILDIDDPTRSISAPITQFDGTKIYFDPLLLLPRVVEEDVVVLSPLVKATQDVLQILSTYADSFSEDAQNLDRALSPLLSQPTLAQINDAKEVLNDIRARVNSLRSSLVVVIVREDQTEFVGPARMILSSLEERGMDRAIDLLAETSFSTFFSLSGENASKSSRAMKAMEEVGRRDFPAQLIESRIRDLEASGSTPSNIIPGTVLPGDGEDVF